MAKTIRKNNCRKQTAAQDRQFIEMINEKGRKTVKMVTHTYRK